MLDRFVTNVALSNDGKFIVLGILEESIKILDRESGILLKSIDTKDCWIRIVTISNDSKYIVSGSE